MKRHRLEPSNPFLEGVTAGPANPFAKTVADDLEKLENEISDKEKKLQKYRNENRGFRAGVKRYGQKAQRYVGTLSSTDVAEKGGAALGKGLNALSTFMSCNANMTDFEMGMTITSGILDTVAAVSEFMPPPASTITGAVSGYGH